MLGGVGVQRESEKEDRSKKEDVQKPASSLIKPCSVAVIPQAMVRIGSQIYGQFTRQKGRSQYDLEAERQKCGRTLGVVRLRTALAGISKRTYCKGAVSQSTSKRRTERKKGG